jgi:hypothetical protein
LELEQHSQQSPTQRRQPTSTTSPRPSDNAVSRLRLQVARPSQRRQPTSTTSRPAITTPSADRPQVARPSQRRQPTSTASRPAIATPPADFDHKSPGHLSAVSRLRLQVARCLRNQPPTSSIKKLHFKLRITQVVYLQSLSIKAHTIYNRVLIVVRAPQVSFTILFTVPASRVRLEWNILEPSQVGPVSVCPKVFHQKN